MIPRLSAYGETTFHSWKDTLPVVNEINTSADKTVVIGYSMGGFSISWLEQANTYPGYAEYPVLTRDVDLAVAYDPRGYVSAPKNDKGEFVEVLHKYKKIVAYHNSVPWGYPVIKYEGPKVETTEISIFHPFVQFSGRLHDLTVKAVDSLKG